MAPIVLCSLTCIVRAAFLKRITEQLAASSYSTFCGRHGLPDPAQVKRLSQEVALPEAAVRGALSYYSDLHHAPELRAFVLEPRACWRAPKIYLSGKRADSVSRCVLYWFLRPLSSGSASRRPCCGTERSCLVEPLLDPAFPEPARPAIRSVAKKTIVTRRIGRGDFSELNCPR